jgi:hypothetical protein
MRQDSSNSSSACDLAVKRIKHLFSRGKEHFLYSAFLDKQITHEYDHSRMIASLQKLTAQKQKAKRVERKNIHAASQVVNKKSTNLPPESSHSIAQTHLCSLNQRYPLLLHFEKGLNERKIKSLQHKEQLIASKNFKKFARQTQDWMYAQFQHRVKVIKEDVKDAANESDNSQVQWEEFLNSKEERHFQINRVIKYLSD